MMIMIQHINIIHDNNDDRCRERRADDGAPLGPMSMSNCVTDRT